MNEEFFYIQDNRSFHGNAVVWWGKDGSGYTSNLSEAGKYSKDQAQKICNNRRSDVAWPVNYIDKHPKAKKVIVDMQYLDYDKRRWIGTKKQHPTNQE